jgi:hypothetical protein
MVLGAQPHLIDPDVNYDAFDENLRWSFVPNLTRVLVAGTPDPHGLSLSASPPSSPHTMTPSISTNKSVHDLPTPEPESPLRSRKPYKFSTLCATVENPNLKDQYGASSVPIYQTATFKGMAGEYDYTRSGNPTRSHLGQFLVPTSVSHVSEGRIHGR